VNGTAYASSWRVIVEQTSPSAGTLPPCPLTTTTRSQPWLADVRPEGVGVEPQRPGELAVLLGDSHRKRGGDDHLVVVGVFGGRGYSLRGDSVGTERGVWAVLFGAADREDREVRRRAVGVRPRRVRESHASAYAGPRQVGCHARRAARNWAKRE